MMPEAAKVTRMRWQGEGVNIDRALKKALESVMVELRIVKKQVDLLSFAIRGWCLALFFSEHCPYDKKVSTVGKKSLIYLKNEVLSEEALDMLCLIFDKIVWKEYKSRTNSNALRKAGSQIGRNIKSLMQVVWYGLWILIGGNPDLYRADLEVFLRAFFYLVKNNYLFFNEHEVG